MSRKWAEASAASMSKPVPVSLKEYEPVALPRRVDLVHLYTSNRFTVKLLDGQQVAPPS